MADGMSWGFATLSVSRERTLKSGNAAAVFGIRELLFFK